MRVLGTSQGMLSPRQLAEVLHASSRAKGMEADRTLGESVERAAADLEGYAEKLGMKELTDAIAKHPTAFSPAGKSWLILSPYVQPCKKLCDSVTSAPGHRTVRKAPAPPRHENATRPPRPLYPSSDKCPRTCRSSTTSRGWRQSARWQS